MTTLLVWVEEAIQKDLSFLDFNQDEFEKFYKSNEVSDVLSDLEDWNKLIGMEAILDVYIVGEIKEDEDKQKKYFEYKLKKYLDNCKLNKVLINQNFKGLNYYKYFTSIEKILNEFIEQLMLSPVQKKPYDMHKKTAEKIRKIYEKRMGEKNNTK